MFSFIRVVMVMVSLHSNKTLTKTERFGGGFKIARGEGHGGMAQPLKARLTTKVAKGRLWVI